MHWKMFTFSKKLGTFNNMLFSRTFKVYFPEHFQTSIFTTFKVKIVIKYKCRSLKPTGLI